MVEVIAFTCGRHFKGIADELDYDTALIKYYTYKFEILDAFNNKSIPKEVSYPPILLKYSKMYFHNIYYSFYKDKNYEEITDRLDKFINNNDHYYFALYELLNEYFKIYISSII